MQLDQLWSKTYAVFQADVSEDVAEKWLPQLRPEGIAGDTLYLSAEPRARSWFELRYGRVLSECAAKASGSDLTVKLVGKAEVPEGLGRDLGSPSVRITADDRIASTELNPRYTFDQFVIGKTNHIGHAASLAVAEQPAQAFNPLFIYGAPGVGKTHLLHAIGNYLGAQAPELNVQYMTAENFASTFRSVLKDNSIGEFKEDLRRTDVLLIDDVQFLQNKVKTEEEFFHTFNALHEAGRQLVITCDRTPHELKQVADRLRERFESGLVVEIEPPDERLRTVILRKRVHVDNIPIDDDLALDRIAARVPANVRSLEGALIRVSAFASMRREPVTTELVDELLDSLHPHTSKPKSTERVSVELIQQVVAEHFELSTAELLGNGRERRLSQPRQLAMYLSCELTEENLPAIAAAFDRDHSTVVHARDKVSGDRKLGGATATTLDRLKEVIHGARSGREQVRQDFKQSTPDRASQPGS
jgi:chromosomal replication initiator protein